MKRSILKTAFILSLLSSPLVFQACTPVGVATGAAATTGVAAAREGGIKKTLTDAGIQAEINDLWFQTDLEMFAKLDLTVNQGRVLITGVVQDPEHRVEAVRLAWQPQGVKQVINEIQITEGKGITGFARDSWISARLRAKITLDRDVQSINYTIDTVHGVIYLMGVAQNQAELNRVIETARTIPDVKRVVSYVKIVGEPVEENASSVSQDGAIQGEPVGEDIQWNENGQVETITIKEPKPDDPFEAAAQRNRALQQNREPFTRKVPVNDGEVIGKPSSPSRAVEQELLSDDPAKQVEF